MARRAYLLLALCAVAAVVAGVLVVGTPRQAPQVSFQTVAGDQFTTDALTGKVVLVNFWATSCVVCVREMPEIVRTYEKYRARGFETIAVAMRYDPPNQVIDYAARKGLPFKVSFDPVGEIAKRFGDVEVTPTTFVLDRRGRIVARFIGEPDFRALHRLLEDKLAEPA